jgi:putative hydrolase
MKFVGDYHMHTKYSDGRATLEEMAHAAMKKGLREIAITDHGPANIVGIKSPEVLLRVKEDAERFNACHGDMLKVLVGVEADVVSCEGDIDVPENIYRQLDLLLVGLHPHVFPKTMDAGIKMILGNQLVHLFHKLRDKVKEVNTKSLVAALYNHPVKIVAHPGLGMPVDCARVARACAVTGCAFEINTGHNYLTPSQLRIVMEEGASIIVNSDAHYTHTVGQLSSGWRILKQERVDPELVVNISGIGRKKLLALREENQ